MDHQPKELRQAATQAFHESLDLLQETLKQNEIPQPSESISKNKPHPPEPQNNLSFDLATFEQAVADIEKFLEQKQSENAGE
jgi:hypothetical protein